MVSFYTTHPTPLVLLLSGMHGDEYGSGKILDQLLKNQTIAVPSYLYIPQVSPSAIKRNTRRNKQNHDINRQFYANTDDQEALEIMKALTPYAFRVAIDVHEDPDRTMAFYIYDNLKMNAYELEAYREMVHTTQARLYTGIDDLEDENLGCHIEKGYYSFRSDWDEDIDKDAGFLSKWMVSHGVTPRVFTVEIPGKAPKELKTSLLTSVIPFLTAKFAV